MVEHATENRSVHSPILCLGTQTPWKWGVFVCPYQARFPRFGQFCYNAVKMNRKKVLRFAIPGVLLVAALILFLGGQRQVTMILDGQAHPARVRALTVGGALRQAGVPVSPQDLLTPGPAAWLVNGMEISVTHARGVSITLLPDGGERQLVSAGRTAAELLAEAGLATGSDDRLWANGAAVTLDQALPPGKPLALVVRRAQTVTLTIGTETRKIHSSAATLGEALADAGILLKPADRLTPAPETPLDGPLSADLRKARTLSIQVDGFTVQARSAAETVGEALAEAGISLQALDYSLPAEAEPLPEDGRLRVVRVQEELVLAQTAVPFTTKYVNSDQVALDRQEVIVPGVLGLQVSRERVRYEDGEEVLRSSDGAWVAQEAREQTVGLGTKIELKTLQTEAGNLEYYRAVTVWVTSYSPCRSGADRCYTGTSSGMKVQKGVIAVPRAWYGLLVGARVYIPGYGTAVVADTGGMTGYWVDVAYSDDDYVPWAQYVTMYFLTPVPSYVPVSLP